MTDRNSVLEEAASFVDDCAAAYRATLTSHDLVAQASMDLTVAAVKEVARGIRALKQEGVKAGVEQDAARWRALISSERITAMGWSGFYTAEDEAPIANSSHLHLTLNFWNKHPPDDGWQAKHGRAMLTAYVDAIVAEQEGASETLPEPRSGDTSKPSSLSSVGRGGGGK